MLLTRLELAVPENEHFALFVHDMESKEQGSGRQLKTTWGQAGLEGGDVTPSETQPCPHHQLSSAAAGQPQFSQQKSESHVCTSS